MKFLKKSEFIKSIVVLTTGTVLAQILNLVAAPVLTRIYSPEEMGELGLYMRIVGFLSAAATLRYEMSFPLPVSDKDSFLLYRLTVRYTKIILIASMIAGLGYFAIQPQGISILLLFVFSVVGSFFLVFTNAGTSWSIRKAKFKPISNAKVVNAGLGNGMKWIFGLAGWGGLGLIFGTLAGQAVSSWIFIKDYFNLKKLFPVYSKMRMKVLGRRYKDFPLVSFPHSMIDVGRDLLLGVFISVIFSKAIFGYFNHSFTMLRLPLVVIGASIGQVFFNRCSEMVNKGENIHGLLKKTMLQLVLLSLVPFTVIYLFGEPLFAFVFGEEWGVAGHYSEIMAIWLGMNFINSPLSNIPLIINRQREYFVLGLINTGIQLFCFLILPSFIGNSEEDFLTILWIVSIAQALFLVLVALITLYYSRSIKVRK